LRNAGLVVAVGGTAAFLLGTSSDDAEPTRPSARGPVEEVETVASVDAVELVGAPRFDDVLVVTQPLADQGGIVVTIDLAAGTIDRRAVPKDDWPADLIAETTEPDFPDADAAVRSPDGTAVAVFTRSSNTRSTGLAMYTESTRVRDFHRMQSVGDVVSGRLVWSPDGDAVYFLAADEDGSADRIIGVAVGGSPQTVATFGQRGFYGIGVADQSHGDTPSPGRQTP
jgi:hypothetical protein